MQGRAGESCIEQIGLRPGVGWYVTALIYGIVGVNVLTASLFGVAAVDHTEPFLASVASIAFAPLAYLAGRRNLREQLVHLPIVMGLALLTLMMLYAGEARGALAIIFLCAVLPPAYLHGLRFASPHIAIGIALMGVSIVVSDEPFAAARAPVAIIVGLLTVAMMALNHDALRRVVSVNRALAEVDPLTGVANLRRFRARLDTEFARARRTGDALVLFTIDLDNFKLVNDRFSHSAGDAVLSGVARSMQRCMVAGDLLARRGRDEFSVLSFSRPERENGAFAAELANAVIAARVKICPGVTPTASVGFVVQVPGETVEQFLARGDAALHQAKSRSRLDRADPIDLDDQGVQAIGQPQARDHGRAVSAAVLEQVDDLSSAWRIAGSIFLFSGLTAMFVEAFGMPGPKHWPGQIGALVVVALAPLCFVAARRELGLKTMTVAWVAGVSIITLGFVADRELAIAMADFYILPALFVFYVSSANRIWSFVAAVPTAAICMALYTFVLVDGGYPHTAERVATTVNLLLIVAILFGRTKHSISRLTEANLNLSEVDSLTGVASLRRLRGGLADELGRGTIQGGRCTLLMLDLDEFKQVNDEFSHSTGDAVLVESARAIERVVREDELVARRGGDEFAVVTTVADAIGLEVLIDRIRTGVADARRAICSEVAPTVSVGYATSEPGDDVESLLRRADFSLQRAKAEGRLNRLKLDEAGALSNVEPLV